MLKLKHKTPYQKYCSILFYTFISFTLVYIVLLLFSACKLSFDSQTGKVSSLSFVFSHSSVYAPAGISNLPTFIANFFKPFIGPYGYPALNFSSYCIHLLVYSYIFYIFLASVGFIPFLIYSKVVHHE